MGELYVLALSHWRVSGVDGRNRLELYFLESALPENSDWISCSGCENSRSSGEKPNFDPKPQKTRNDSSYQFPVSSSVRGFQIWTVEPTGDNEFNVTYSVDQLITEGENTKTVHSAYIVSVYVDGSGNMVLVKNPTITNIPKKSSYKPKAIESEGTVDSITTNEINEFLTTFFKLYPTATASELSYYVNDGILKPIGKEYIFQELVNPIHNRKDNQVTVSLTVEYIDQQTKATQVSQFDLVLEKNGSNWKIIE